MGNGIAHVCAQYGNEVILVDVQQAFLDKAIQTITANLDRQVQKGTLSEEDKHATLARLTTSTQLSAAVSAGLLSACPARACPRTEP